MSDAPPTLKHLAESAETLNRITEDANEAVSRVEEVLNHYGVGSREFACVKDLTMEPRKGFCQFLESRRINNRYRICVIWTKGPDFVEESYKPWSDCSRTEKLQTVVALPALIEEIYKIVESQLSLANAAKPAIDRVRGILKSQEEGK